MKCLLVSVNCATVPYPVYPLGTAHLAGALEQAGHLARLYDILAMGGLSGLEQEIRDFSPGLIGVSIRNLDNVDSTDPVSFLQDVTRVMSVIRGCCDVPVVVGGPAFAIFPEKFMEILQADYGVTGQGENVLVRLAADIEAGDPPASGTIIAGSGEAEWYPVKYDTRAAPYYVSAGGMLNIQTKRGCPFRCTYCSYPLIEGRRIRCRNPEEVASDAIRLAREHGARYLFFTDAVFNDPGEHYLQVAEALIRAGNTLPWCAFFRPSGLSRENLSLLKRAGLAGMELGTDGTTDETMEGFGKGFTFGDVEQCSMLARSLEIPCAHFCMFGGPGETLETIPKGISNLERFASSVVFAFAGIRILPGTAIYDMALEQGIISEEQDIFEPVFYFSPGLDFHAIDTSLRDAWGTRLDRIYPCSVLYEHIGRLHKRGYTGPLWDILVRH